MSKHAFCLWICMTALGLVGLGCTDLELKDSENNLGTDGGDGSVDENVSGSGGQGGAGGAGGSGGSGGAGASGGSGGNGGSGASGGAGGSGGSTDTGGSGGGEPRRCEDGCDDGLPCTEDSCDEKTGQCVTAVTTGCRIDGACVDALAFDPDNDCLRCVPEIDPKHYSPVAEGTVCTSDDPMRIFLECDGEGSCGRDYCELYDCWSVPPTGQTQCVIDGVAAACPGLAGSGTCGVARGCGQDAQYPDDPPREFTTTTAGGDVLVTDTHTGLVWQGEVYDCDPSEDRVCSHYEADAYCFNSTYGGHNDWRLPSIYELLELIAPGQYMPATMFTDSEYPEGWQVWSATIDADDDELAFVMTYQAAANAPWPPFERTNPAGGARCVRGDTRTRDSSERFVELGSGGETYALDRSTGLIWQATSTESVTWYEALAHCEGLTYADRSDWRLPDFHELLSLQDVTRTTPPTTRLPGGASEVLWSSSRGPLGAGIGDASYPVLFDGTMLITPFLPPTSQENSARCVRDYAP